MPSPPPIRVLVAKPGLDGHDRGAKIVTRALREAGMQVIYTGLPPNPRNRPNHAPPSGSHIVEVPLQHGQFHS